MYVKSLTAKSNLTREVYHPKLNSNAKFINNSFYIGVICLFVIPLISKICYAVAHTEHDFVPC